MTTNDGDLSVTALYTSGVWTWAGFPNAGLYRSVDADRVFGVTNFFLRIVRWVKGGPSLPHSLAQRHAMIDWFTSEAKPTRVLELAAGLSRRGATFSEDPSVQYIEVDLPHVVARKNELLQSTPEGQAVAARPNLIRTAEDVRQLDMVALRPDVVISEGLLMYLDAEAQQTLWRRIVEALPSGRYIFDFVPTREQPKAGWMGRVLGWLMRRFTRGQGFVEDPRGRDQIVAELLEAGFHSARWVEPSDLPAEAQVPYLDQPTQTLVYVCETSVR